jgi:hypothetical protein
MRLDNVFFDGDEPIFLDWQIANTSPGAYDLGYFNGQSLAIEDRRDRR